MLGANETYADGFPAARAAGARGEGLAALTCIDSRIEPLAMLGLPPGDAKILRNAAAPRHRPRTPQARARLVPARRRPSVVIAHTDAEWRPEAKTTSTQP